jgi:hypothetical protein
MIISHKGVTTSGGKSTEQYDVTILDTYTLMRWIYKQKDFEKLKSVQFLLK